jgi:hypothetical protein
LLTDTQRLIFAGFSTRVNRVIDCSVNSKAPRPMETGRSRAEVHMAARSIGSIERFWRRAGLIPQETSQAARLANSATSLKQAVLVHLRGFFKNAAYRPVDDGNSKSQN